MKHERLQTLKNKLRVLVGGGVGIKEGTYCMEHWVCCINNVGMLKNIK